MTVSEVVHVTVTEIEEACHQTEVIIPIVHETPPSVVHETIVVPPMVHTTPAAPPMVHTTLVTTHQAETTLLAPPMVHETAITTTVTNHMAPSSTSEAAMPPPASSLSLGYMMPHNARRWQA
ncbi:hypothetical protein F4811DRAFT_526928 [Daldinia bambusicola]|nr:hypothetical protein F4811DRAFT_526928 [Daldinia bambusicola]